MDDFVHGVRSNVRWIGVKIEQKRPCMPCSKCYYGLHNDPRLLRFSTEFRYLNSFPMEKFYIVYCAFTVSDLSVQLYLYVNSSFINSYENSTGD